MRKTLLFVLIILLLLGTVGCGSKKPPNLSDIVFSENPALDTEKKTPSETTSVPNETGSDETDVTEATENKETDNNHTASPTEQPTATTPTSEETYHDTSGGDRQRTYQTTKAVRKHSSRNQTAGTGTDNTCRTSGCERNRFGCR